MSVETSTSKGAEAVGKNAKPPRASDWLWRPGYMKLVWSLVAIYWLGVGISSFVLPSSILSEYEGMILFLGVAFHPFLIIPVAGAGFLRAWMDHRTSKGAVGEMAACELRYRGYFDFRFHRRTSPVDPLNVSQVANPMNPASKTWRDRYLRARR